MCRTRKRAPEWEWEGIVEHNNWRLREEERVGTRQVQHCKIMQKFMKLRKSTTTIGDFQSDSDYHYSYLVTTHLTSPSTSQITLSFTSNFLEDGYFHTSTWLDEPFCKSTSLVQPHNPGNDNFDRQYFINNSQGWKTREYACYAWKM